MVCALVEVIEVIEVKGRGVEAGAGQGEVRWEGEANFGQVRFSGEKQARNLTKSPADTETQKLRRKAH